MPLAQTVISGSGAPVTTQVGPADPSGQIISGNVNSPLGFFATTPIAQPASQGSLKGTAGVFTVYATTQTPASVASNTTAEQTVTVTGVVSGDMIIINKPTSQAGLAIVGVRASATNTVAITFGNDTGSPITPTAGETYVNIDIPKAMTYQPILSPAAVAPNTTAEQQFTVTGLPTGTAVFINKPTAQAGLGIVGARAVSANTLGITFCNFTAATITPTASQTYLVYASAQVQIQPVQKTLSALLAPSSVAANTTAEQTFTVTGLLANSQVVVTKPSVQQGLGIGGTRVSAANTLAINYVNDTAAAITPATETYLVAVFEGAAPAAGSSTSYNAQLGGDDHAALVGLGLVAGP